MTEATCNFPTRQNTGHPLFDLSNKLTARIRAKQQRRKLAGLMDLDSHALKDIGLTHNDVAQALNQPLSVDVNTELHRIAHLNSRNLM